MDRIPLIVVCGPTASGKTKAAVELAKKYTIDESGFINGILGSVVRDKEGAK